MSKRQLSQTPAAIEARERRMTKSIEKQEREWNAKIRALMDKGMTFDEAWIAAGGMIIPDLVKI